MNKKLHQIPLPETVKIIDDDFHFTIRHAICLGTGSMDICYTSDKWRAEIIERAMKHWLTSEDAAAWWEETLKRDGYKL